MAIKIRMRKCETCRKLKDIKKFHKKENICKNCIINKSKTPVEQQIQKSIEIQKIKYEASARQKDVMKLMVNDIRALIGCQICKYNKFIGAIEFHHVEPKLFNICRKPYTIDIVTEMKKCIILCCNCHREVTHGLKIDDLEVYRSALVRAIDEYIAQRPALLSELENLKKQGV